MVRRAPNVSMGVWVIDRIVLVEIVGHETKMIVRMATGLAVTSANLLRTRTAKMARDHAGMA